MTTDVQNVSLCVASSPSIWSIRCSYARNSHALGCHYELINRHNGAPNITGTIFRGNQHGEYLRIHNISHYEDIVAYDWEMDGSTGTFPVRKSGGCH